MPAESKIRYIWYKHKSKEEYGIFDRKKCRVVIHAFDKQTMHRVLKYLNKKGS